MKMDKRNELFVEILDRHVALWYKACCVVVTSLYPGGTICYSLDRLCHRGWYGG